MNKEKAYQILIDNNIDPDAIKSIVAEVLKSQHVVVDPFEGASAAEVVAGDRGDREAAAARRAGGDPYAAAVVGAEGGDEVDLGILDEEGPSDDELEFYGEDGEVLDSVSDD